jgi:hypothetical protein
MRDEGNPLLCSQARYLSRPKSARWVSLRSTHPTSLGALLRREARHGNAEVNQNLNAKDANPQRKSIPIIEFGSLGDFATFALSC